MSSQLQQPLYFKLVEFVACYEANCKAIRLRVFHLERALMEPHRYVATMLLEIIFSQIYKYAARMSKMLILKYQFIGEKKHKH